MKKKAVKLMSILLAAALLVCASVGGTLAYLSAKTQTVTNTFTVGNINITLTENTGDSYKMVPGNKIDKDPEVTVVAGSEACWLFVKIDENHNTFTVDGTDYQFITYTEANGWTPLDGEAGVYYRTVSANDAENGVSYPVFDGDKVSVSADITKGIMDGITEANRPKLAITAYAVQSANIPGDSVTAKVATAWNIAKTEAVASTNP